MISIRIFTFSLMFALMPLFNYEGLSSWIVFGFVSTLWWWPRPFVCFPPLSLIWDSIIQQNFYLDFYFRCRVDELKVYTEEELVEIALKEAFTVSTCCIVSFNASLKVIFFIRISVNLFWLFKVFFYFFTLLGSQ